MDAYIQDLHRLSKDCNFKEVTAEQHRQGHVRDAFVSGIRSKEIRQKIIENAAQNSSVSMDQIFDQARTLQMAQKNAESYTNTSFSPCAATYTPQHEHTPQHELNHIDQMAMSDEALASDTAVAAMYSQNCQACFFCGNSRHATRSQCPARRHKCQLCGKVGHWERVCQSSDPNRQRQSHPFQQSFQRNNNNNNNNNNSSSNNNNRNSHQQRNSIRGTSAAIWPFLAATDSVRGAGNKVHAFCSIKIKKKTIKSLIDTGSFVVQLH